MKKLYINPFFKFSFLFLQLLLVIFFDKDNNLLMFLLLSILMLFLTRVKVKNILKSMVFGVFLAIFSFIFTYFISGSINLSIYKSIHLVTIYLIILFYSLAYKKTSSNKEISYVISCIFLPLKKIGYNQNKMYTMIIIILNQVGELRESAKRIYKYDSLNRTDNIGNINRMIILIRVFINNSLKQNENFTVALISKGYSIENKKVKPFFIYDYKIKYYLILFVYLLLEILIIFK